MAALLAAYDQFTPSFLHPDPLFSEATDERIFIEVTPSVLSKEGIPKSIQEKVTTDFMIEHESPSTFCCSPSEANLVLCSCTKPYFL